MAMGETGETEDEVLVRAAKALRVVDSLVPDNAMNLAKKETMAMYLLHLPPERLDELLALSEQW
jgi:hypothetical protein